MWLAIIILVVCAALSEAANVNNTSAFRTNTLLTMVPKKNIKLSEYPSLTMAANLKLDRRINTTEYDAFQLYPPITNYGSLVYSQPLLNHTFANSYHKPVKIQYQPPQVEFNRVVLNLEVSTNGYQYDRLGSIFMGGVEVWRTSTAEPGGRDIKFGHVKDVSRHVNLFRDINQLVFSLNNVVNEKFTGKFYAKLSASYYNASIAAASTMDPSSVLSSMQRRSGGHDPPTSITPLHVVDKHRPGDTWVHPSDDMAVELEALPRNITQVGLEILATGHSDEEFWYSSVTNKTCQYLNVNAVSEMPVRAVSVFINDELAGQAIPEPIIYTGGISPYMWTPVVGMDAFDIPHLFVDLTPYLPTMWSQSSVLRIKITNGVDYEKILNVNWLVSAALVTWDTANVTGDGHQTVIANHTQNDSFERVAPYFAANKHDHTAHHDADSLHQGVGITTQLTREAHLVFVHDNGNMEGIRARWSQVVLGYSFISVDDQAQPRQVGHYQSESSSLEIQDLKTKSLFHPVDRVLETPMLINLETKADTTNARIVKKSSRFQSDTGSSVYYLFSNSTVATLDNNTLQAGEKSRAVTQQALIHQPAHKNQVYMRHVAASDGSMVFDGRWRGKLTKKTHPPDRMSRFIRQVDQIKEFVVDNAKAVNS